MEQKMVYYFFSAMTKTETGQTFSSGVLRFEECGRVDWYNKVFECICKHHGLNAGSTVLTSLNRI